MTRAERCWTTPASVARRAILFAGVWLGMLSVASGQSPIQLDDVTGQTGIRFRHTDGSSGLRYIFEPFSAGIALFDYDGDGWIDIYFLNGAPLRGTPATGQPKNALYRNLGGWKFADVSAQAGVDDRSYGLGVAVADYDHDGDPDLYLNNFGPNVLYRNNGDGTFSEATSEAGVGNGEKVGAGACFLDIDSDGLLDLYAASYVRFSYETHRPRTRRGMAAYPSPLEYSPEPDTLYRNRGDGSFEDVSAESGIAAHAGTSMGTVAADYDDDGDTDIFVACDVMANLLFQNDGSGKFEEVGLFSGMAYDVAGIPQGSMGAACADYDNDGRLDFHVTSFSRELATLHRNLNQRFFADATRRSGAAAGTFAEVTWGNGFVDFDSDGDRDLFIACGHFDESVDLRGGTSLYLAPNILLMNTGDGRFVDVSGQSGDGMQVRRSSRGAGFDDLDNDGDVDAVILNSRHEPTVLKNDSAGGNHWIQVQLRGTRTNRDGAGARVKIVAGKSVQIGEVHSGQGYQSHFGTRLHFGLASHDRVERIEVRWIGGAVDVLQDVAADRLITIVEGANAPPATEGRASQ